MPFLICYYMILKVILGLKSTLFEISHYCHWCFSINGKLLATNFEITMPFIFRWMILVILKMTLEICTLPHYYFDVLLSSYIFIIAIHIKSFYCTEKTFAKQVPFIIYIKVLHNSTDSILTKRIMSIYLGISLHWQYLYSYLGTSEKVFTNVRYIRKHSIAHWIDYTPSIL